MPHCKKPTLGQALLVFADTQSQRKKTKRACPTQPHLNRISTLYTQFFEIPLNNFTNLATYKLTFEISKAIQ